MSTKKPTSHTSLKLTATPPPPKTFRTPTYMLDHYTLRRHVKVVTIQLHGIRGSEQHTESISLPLYPQISDADYIQATVYFSPNKWSAPFSMNFKQFQGNFGYPLKQELLMLLMQPSQPSGNPVQSEPVLHDAPTVANISFSQAAFTPPPPQPGQFQQSYSSQAPMYGQQRGNTVWGWYKTRTRNTKIGLGCGFIIAILLFFSCISSGLAVCLYHQQLQLQRSRLRNSINR